MDIFDQGNQEAPKIDQLVVPNPFTPDVPQTAVKTQAAKVAMVASPQDVQGSYNQMVGEAQQGNKTTQNMLQGQMVQKAQNSDQASLLAVMSDPTIPIAQKQSAIAQYNKMPELNDSSTIMQNNFHAAPVQGETPTAEDARISTVDAMREMYDSRSQIQAMTNQLHQATGNPSLFGQFLNHAVGLIPGYSAVQQNKTLNDLASATGVDRKWWSNLSVILASGNQMQAAQKQIASLPPQQQVAVAKEMYKNVQAHSGFIFGSDNEASAYDQFQQLFGEQYGTGAAGLHNLLGSLDATFLSATAGDLAKAGKGVVRAIAGGTGPLDASEAASFMKANANTPSAIKAAPTGSPAGIVNDVKEPGFSPLQTVAQDEPQAAGGALQNAVSRANSAGSNVSSIDTGSALTGGSGVNLSQVSTNKRAALFANAEDTKATMARLKQQSVVHDIQPNTSMEIAQNSNPDVARSMHEAIQNGTDEVAEALSGVPKDQAIVNNTMPQVSNTGTVFSRTADIAKNARVDNIDPMLVGVENNIGANALTPEEWSNVMYKVSNDFGNATGLRLNDSMSSFSHTGDRINIRGVYENPSGSWNSPEQAMEQAKLALREYGVQDSDITLLAKQGINHVPVSLDDARGLNGDYKIGVNINPEFSGGLFNDVHVAAEGKTPWSNLDVKRNITDSFSGTQWNRRGSLARYALDAQSMLHRTITNSASIGVDYAAKYEKVLMNQLNDFATGMRSVGKARQAKINDYLQEANFNRIDFDPTDLVARGFSSSEIGVIRQFRDFQDRLYGLENLDVVRGMRNQGYQLFDHPNVRGYVKAIPSNTTIREVYDPTSDSVRNLSKQEVDDLYAKGGNIGSWRNTMNLAGQDVDHVMIRQIGTEYSRALRDNDRILNKLPGYYHIDYKAAKFVDEVNESGQKVRTLAVAGDTESANSFMNRMQANNPTKKYKVRNDSKDSLNSNDSNEVWDLNNARGRVNQRYRGQLLQGSDVPNHLGQATYIENPAKASENAAKSIANRTAMRNVIDTAQSRFMDQYKDVLPVDKFGRKSFPASADEIGSLGDKTSKQVADARTTYEYINYLRSGYINSMNNASKAVLSKMADVAGEYGASKIERALGKAGEANITQSVKKGVFYSYLATNPLRQLIIQPAQAIRTLSYNPSAWANGAIPKDMIDTYRHAFLNGPATDFTKFLDQSGLMDAVKHHNLTNGALMSIADNQSIPGAVLGKGLNALKEVGFDAGESANMLVHASAVFNRFKEMGKNVKDVNVMQEIHAETRNLTYALNRAGDMPYNQGTASMLLQFMHMPHKALLQYTNRGLDSATKWRMLAGDLILYGAPLSFAIKHFNLDPVDDPKARDLIENGITQVWLNKTLAAIDPGSAEKDFSGLAPYDLHGWGKLWDALTHSGLNQAIANSPAGTLSGNKIGQVAQDMVNWFAPKNYDTRTNIEHATGLIHDIARLSSGFSNAEKAIIMHNLGQRRDQYGMVLNDNPTFSDTLLQAFGFQDQADTDRFNTQQDLQNNKIDFRKNVLKQYNAVKKYYADQYNTDEDPDMHRMQDVAGAALAQYANNPQAMEIIMKEWSRDMNGKDATLALNMMRSMQIPGSNKYREQIDNGPWDDNMKQQMHKMLDAAQKAQVDVNQMTGME